MEIPFLKKEPTKETEKKKDNKEFEQLDNVPIGKSGILGLPINEIEGKAHIDQSIHLAQETRKLKDALKKKDTKAQEEAIEEILFITQEVKENGYIIDSKPTGPIVMLMKTNNQVEVYQKVNAGRLKFRGTDGKEKIIILSTSKIMSFPWGKDVLKGWICFENEATPYPHEPIHDATAVSDVIAEALSNKKDLEAGKIVAFEGLAQTLVLGFFDYSSYHSYYYPCSREKTSSNTLIQNQMPN